MTLRINLICSEPHSVCRNQVQLLKCLYLNMKKRDSEEDIKVNGRTNFFFGWLVGWLLTYFLQECGRFRTSW